MSISSLAGFTLWFIWTIKSWFIWTLGFFNNSKICRWQNELSRLNLTVEYIEGASNALADWLSRSFIKGSYSRWQTSIAAVPRGDKIQANSNDIVTIWYFANIVRSHLLFREITANLLFTIFFANFLWIHNLHCGLIKKSRCFMNSLWIHLSISQRNFESNIYFTISLWIHLVFHWFTMNSLSVP